MINSFSHRVQELLSGKEEAVSDLTTRSDDWSFQVMSETSDRFFVRVTSPIEDNKQVVFSDFTLNPDDDDRALAALDRLKAEGFHISRGSRLLFQNIHPSYKNDTDRAELVRRHDQIVSVITCYAHQENLSIEDAMLDQNLGHFDTSVLLS